MTKEICPHPHPGTKCQEERGNLYCVGDVIDHDGSLGPPIVHGGQAVIPLLSSCVPDLKFDCCVVQTDRLCEEGRCKRESGVTRQEGVQKPPPGVSSIIPGLWHSEAPCFDRPREALSPAAKAAPRRVCGVCVFLPQVEAAGGCIGFTDPPR